MAKLLSWPHKKQAVMDKKCDRGILTEAIYFSTFKELREITLMAQNHACVFYFRQTAEQVLSWKAPPCKRMRGSHCKECGVMLTDLNHRGRDGALCTRHRLKSDKQKYDARVIVKKFTRAFLQEPVDESPLP